MRELEQQFRFFPEVLYRKAGKKAGRVPDPVMADFGFSGAFSAVFPWNRFPDSMWDMLSIWQKI